jgi:hypothetical protein
MLVDKCDNSHIGLLLKREADVVMIVSEVVDSISLDVMKGFLTHCS